VNNLKHTLRSIDTSGDNPAVYVTPNHDLLVKLRRYIFENVERQSISVDEGDWRNSSFFGDILDNERFERRIRYCVIRLREVSVSETEFFAYISQALSIALERFQKYRQGKKPQQRSTTTLQRLFVEEIARCFEIWYYPLDLSNPSALVSAHRHSMVFATLISNPSEKSEPGKGNTFTWHPNRRSG